jgi:hypothetical protein
MSKNAAKKTRMVEEGIRSSSQERRKRWVAPAKGTRPPEKFCSLSGASPLGRVSAHTRSSTEQQTGAAALQGPPGVAGGVTAH